MSPAEAPTCPTCESSEVQITASSVKTVPSWWIAALWIGGTTLSAVLLFTLASVLFPAHMDALYWPLQIGLFLYIVVVYILLVRRFGSTRTMSIYRCGQCQKTWYTLRSESDGVQ
jgi:hypothetical protein